MPAHPVDVPNFVPAKPVKGAQNRAQVLASLFQLLERTQSEAMQTLLRRVNKVTSMGDDIGILITGETGVGKEILARYIHAKSETKGATPFVAINCSAIPCDLLEAELFGVKKGSFTGANSDRRGKFEEANGGTLFLDEVTTLPLAQQTKLLRVLQERRVTPVGGRMEDEKELNIRVIAACNQDIKKCIAKGEFRDDLYFRLNVIQFAIPPLRERKEDVPALLDYYLSSATEDRNLPGMSVTEDTFAALRDYSWPGNIRELAHTVTRAIINALTDDRHDLNIKDFEIPQDESKKIAVKSVEPPTVGAAFLSRAAKMTKSLVVDESKMALGTVSAQLIYEALRECIGMDVAERRRFVEAMLYKPAFRRPIEDIATELSLSPKKAGGEITSTQTKIRNYVSMRYPPLATCPILTRREFQTAADSKDFIAPKVPSSADASDNSPILHDAGEILLHGYHYKILLWCLSVSKQEFSQMIKRAEIGDPVGIDVVEAMNHFKKFLEPMEKVESALTGKVIKAPNIFLLRPI